MEKFKDWYKEKLRSKSMSAGEFAQRARISRAASYFYLDGSRVPNEAALSKIALAFQIERSSMPTFASKS
jgi:predicted transcriptional regulator